jgi:UDP-galactopyranose mutase
MQSMIVFSHLRWDFVFQRPQHLMTRFAKRRPVYFIEEPVDAEGPARLEVREPVAGVHVCRPLLPGARGGFSSANLPGLRDLLDELVTKRSLRNAIAWFYTPMALPLLQGLDPAVVVYDCMDELSAFLNAPRELIEMERLLMKVADVVFTGGPSLYRSKRALHPNVHCFTSSVDREHFGRGRDASLDHDEQRTLPHPRLGFFGVIDERFDPVSIALAADAHPDWQLVMVGPVVKIDPQTLPRRPNIHYFGQRSYTELPRFLAGWDVALLPFAMNESTKFISPTKVLEYMAAEKEIVSTPVTDVVEPYGKIVHIARTSQEFVGACERALAESGAAREKRVTAMRAVINGTSWDATAEKMTALIEAAGRERGTRGQATPRRKRAVVIGAGPTGLSAAYHLGDDSLLVEQEAHVGGWCRSSQVNGFTFDCAGHIMFSNDAYVHELYRKLLGDNVHWQDREAWIWSKGVYTRYPFQGALYGLPPEVLKDCIVGAIEARFGSLKAPAEKSNGHANGHAKSSSPAACKAESITDCCADGIVASTAPLTPGKREFRNFEEFIYGVWGAGVAKHFAIPYNRKLWAVPLTEMETSWLGGRVPLPDLEEMIEGALQPVAKPQGPNARFGYPLRGGFQALMDGFLPHLAGDLRLSARVERVVPSEHLVVLDDGSRYTYEKLISTMPLPALVKLVGKEAPTRVVRAAAKLRHVSVRCVNLGVARENVSDKHWIYYPEDSVFHRIFVQGNASPHNNPPGGFGFTCEITYSPHKPLPCDGEALVERCIADCIKVGFLRPDDRVIARSQVDMPYAYVVYDHARAANVAIVREWLASQDIELAGRYSEWEYYNSDHAFLAGKNAAERVTLALRARDKAAQRVPLPAATTSIITFAPPVVAPAKS